MDSTRSSVPGVAVTPENAGHRAWLGRQLMAGLPTCVDTTPRAEAAGARVRVGSRRRGGPDRTGAAAPLGLSIAHIRSQTIPDHERGKWFADVVYERRRKRLQNDARQRAEEVKRGIEHLDPPRLAAMERAVFEFARPQVVVVTTPNVEYNVRFETLPAGEFRHRDHRFEWTRAQFEAWANGVAGRFGYSVRFAAIGTDDPEVGSPTQMGVFERG